MTAKMICVGDQKIYTPQHIGYTSPNQVYSQDVTIRPSMASISPGELKADCTYRDYRSTM